MSATIDSESQKARTGIESLGRPGPLMGCRASDDDDDDDDDEFEYFAIC